MKIVIEHVSKKIGLEQVLSDISLDLSSGTIYGFVGKNGSGKSMLLKTICGFVTPDEGSVIVGNIDIYRTHTFPRSTAALIESPNYLPELSGYENLKMLADIQKKIGQTEIGDTLRTVNLYEEKDKKFKKYSLGMKQKLAIAQVLMENPDVMIFDEPFNGLEEESTDKIRKILLDKKKENKLILIATHNKEDIEKLCDVLFYMDKGVLKKQSKK